MNIDNINNFYNLKIKTMKTRINAILFTLLLVLLSPFAKASADVNGPITSMSDMQEQTRIIEIQNRVEAIKAMDKSQLSKQDKLELKEELKNMRHEEKIYARAHGGVYLSIGAVILIIIILIIVL